MVGAAGVGSYLGINKALEQTQGQENPLPTGPVPTETVKPSTATPKFNPSEKSSGKSIAILVKGDLTLDPTVTELNGIFIVQGTIKTGTATQGLKINGNLIAQSALTQGRSQPDTDNNKPSLFIVFNPAYYLDLLKYLSIDIYDWRQLR